jgi:hypothetical protein
MVIVYCFHNWNILCFRKTLSWFMLTLFSLFDPPGNPMKPSLSANVRPVGYETWRIAWITESFANISEYRLLYRKVPVSCAVDVWMNVDGSKTLLCRCYCC